MSFECQLCGIRRSSEEWTENISQNPGDIEEQIHHLERIQAEIRSDPLIVNYLVENGTDLCPMCEKLLDGIRDMTDEEELDTRITFQVAYLEDKVDRWATKPY